MDIHKPKPWHGVREFLKEYVIVVVGVLTALAAEQAVAFLHTQSEIREARDALIVEIGQDATLARASAAEDRCLLVAYRKWADWARGGRRPEIDDSAAYVNLVSTVWETSKSGAVSHMRQKERLAFANFYGDVDTFNRIVTAQQQAALTIFSFEGGEKLSETQSQSLLGATNVATRMAGYQLRGEPVIEKDAQRLGATITIPAGMRDYLVTFCRSVGAPPPSL